MQFNTLEEALAHNSEFGVAIDDAMAKIVGINTISNKSLDVINFELANTLEFYDQYYEGSPLLTPPDSTYKIKTSIATPGYNMNNLTIIDNIDNFITSNPSKLSNNGVVLANGQGCCLRIKTDHPWYSGVVPDIFYNVYIANTDDTGTTYNGLITNNEYNSTQLNFLVGNGSIGTSFIDTVDTTFQQPIGDLVVPTTGGVLTYLDSILNKLVIRKTKTSPAMGKLKKLEISPEKIDLIQIASNYKITDTLMLLNLNAITQTYPSRNNTIRFNSLIFVPIRTDLNETLLIESIKKALIKEKLLAKLV